jgi:hypothetical protein
MEKENFRKNESQKAGSTRRKPDPRTEIQLKRGQESPLADLQHKIGNQGVQRLVAQRSGGAGAFELDDETAGRINHQRGGGQPLDSAMASLMGEATGHDLSEVRVHTSPEAVGLNQQLEAKAFTTGQDIFFSDGAYQPGSTSGQQLLAHELTHVVQQSSGAVPGGGSGMTVNAPGDSFEQQADAVARVALGTGPEIQRQELGEDTVEEEA